MREIERRCTWFYRDTEKIFTECVFKWKKGRFIFYFTGGKYKMMKALHWVN